MPWRLTPAPPNWEPRLCRPAKSQTPCAAWLSNSWVSPQQWPVPGLASGASCGMGKRGLNNQAPWLNHTKRVEAVLECAKTIECIAASAYSASAGALFGPIFRDGPRSPKCRCCSTSANRSGPARHDDAHGGHLQHIAVLVAGFAAHRDHTAVGFGFGRLDLDDLAHHV